MYFSFNQNLFVYRIFILKYLILAFFTASCFHTKFDIALSRNPVIKGNSYTDGKILIVPYLGRAAGLYNKKGYFEKIWTLNKPTFYGELMGNNILIVHFHKRHFQGKTITDLDAIPKKGPFHIIGSTGIIATYDYNGKLKSNFEDTSLHHDISIKDQTRIFALSWQIKTFFYKKEPFVIAEDSIVEIDIKNSKIIKKLPLSDYFPIDKYFNMSKKYPQKDRLNNIFHTNGIDYIKENPINGNEAVLITMRNYNEGTVALIDLQTNKLLWKSKKGDFTFPHDAKFTKDKTITVFNNGAKKNMKSEVVELNIKTNEILWKFDGKNKFLSFRLFSPFISGVHKTEKGYLITVGSQGRILEVSKDKEIVWELPAAASVFRHFIDNSLITEIFKVRQY